MRKTARADEDMRRAELEAGRARTLKRAEKSETLRRALRHNARVAEAERRKSQDPDQRD
jgi:hypothetical protein